MKFRYHNLNTHPRAIQLFKLFWFNHFREYEIIRITSWRGAAVSYTDPNGGGRFEHVTACPKWASWLD